MDSLKIVLKGVLAIFLSFLLCKIMTLLGWRIPGCFGAVLFGILAPMVLPAKDIKGNILLFLCFGTIFSSILPVILGEYYGFGSSAGTIRLSEAADHPFSTMYSFTDAYVKADWYGRKGVMGRRGKVGDMYAAPVFSISRKPGDPVKVWTISDTRPDPKYFLGCYEALQRLDDDDAQVAIERAASEYGLKVAEKPILVEWCRDASAKWKWTWIRDSLMPLAASIIFAFAYLISSGSVKKDQ